MRRPGAAFELRDLSRCKDGQTSGALAGSLDESGAGSPHSILAVWREAGEWWANEPYREVQRFIDARGIRREEETLLPSLGALARSGQEDYQEDNTIEVSERARKIRDEKVSAACGSLPPSYYENQLWHRATDRLTPNPITQSPKSKIIPSREARRDDWGMTTGYSGIKAVRIAKSNAPPYVPLHVYSGYAFGRGTMLAEEIPLIAAGLGISACAITDPMSLVGAVEFSKACRKHGLKPIVGATFEMPEGGELVLLARTKRGFRNLSQLITACHLEEPRLFPLCSWERLARFREDLICLTGGDAGPLNRLLVRRDFAAAESLIQRLIAIYGRENVYVEVEHSYLPWQIPTNRLLIELAEKLNLQPFAGGLVTHARPEDFPVQDILTCIDTLCTVEEIVGRKLPRDPSQPEAARYPERALNAERYLKAPEEMGPPDLSGSGCRINPAVPVSQMIADRIDDDVLPERTQLPQIYDDDNHALREITMMGAYQRHDKITNKLRSRLDYELKRIIGLGYARHFLAAYDMVRWADAHQIQFSGRGSVVDSAVAFCLGFSRIDALKHNLHFDRFLPVDGSKRPDIDIDFEARHRDDVREYLTQKYGRDHVATVAAVGAYCTRGIVREVGKALGLPNETICFLAKRIHGGVPAHQLESALEQRPELKDSHIPKERFQWVFRLAEKMMDVPRNMRAHSSGVVISDRPICETVPVMGSASVPEIDDSRLTIDDFRQPSGNRQSSIVNSQSLPSRQSLRIIQWDKRSAKYFFDKFDVLCLRGQDVLAGTESRVRINSADFSVTRIPTDDPETYRAMRSGELIGIPQSASPAMRQAHIRLKTENLHDASLVQAGIRPGVGGAVKLNQLIARRLGKEKYSFEHPELEKILGHTYGIIVFQEQVDQLLQTFCGFSSGQAEDLRDSIYKKRREDFTKEITDELLKKVIERGFSRPIAEKVVDYVVGFKGYGFAEGHALAFAEISIRSIYCQQNFPSEYFAALLSAQPAGYYGPCTIVNEARGRGVIILPPDLNRSEEEFTVEDVLDHGLVIPGGGIRIALSQIANLSKLTRERIARWERAKPFAHSPAAKPLQEMHSVAYRRDGGAAVMVAESECLGSRWSDENKGTPPTRAPRLSEPLPPTPPRPCLGSRWQGENDDPPLARATRLSLPHAEEEGQIPNSKFQSFFDFAAKICPERDELEQLILCGFFDSVHPNRRALLWAIPA
ncbi:MAG TPA: PHP domain-containing protein, partial [Fimbriimonadaceae bacterium]|nr:PHP domain-containing protein [Fimbriimonadaceae bacterium]